jgi:hypothetical protein
MAAATKREYTVTDTGTVVCFASEKFDCVVVDPKVTGGLHAFLTANELTDSHDAELARCTDEINRILGKATAKNHDHGRHLSILLTDRGPMLAWVVPGVDKDEPAALARALRIEN